MIFDSSFSLSLNTFKLETIASECSLTSALFSSSSLLAFSIFDFSSSLFSLPESISEVILALEETACSIFVFVESSLFVNSIISASYLAIFAKSYFFLSLETEILLRSEKMLSVILLISPRFNFNSDS